MCNVAAASSNNEYYALMIIKSINRNIGSTAHSNVCVRDFDPMLRWLDENVWAQTIWMRDININITWNIYFNRTIYAVMHTYLWLLHIFIFMIDIFISYYEYTNLILKSLCMCATKEEYGSIKLKKKLLVLIHVIWEIFPSDDFKWRAAFQ